MASSVLWATCDVMVYPPPAVFCSLHKRSHLISLDTTLPSALSVNSHGNLHLRFFVLRSRRLDWKAGKGNYKRVVAVVTDTVRSAASSQLEKGAEFDRSAPPPFSLADIKAAIPKYCWVKDTNKSLSYFFRDVALVFGLATAAASVDNWLVWPLYWLAQGTMFWALFVLGHDCGHGSFSSSKTLNAVIGHLTHSFILVPYHGWRISHRTHHQNHGHAEKDESWHPLTESQYRSLDPLTRWTRFTVLSMFAYPVYLWVRSPGKSGSHFHPSSPLFAPSEKKDVLMSSVAWGAMASLVTCLTVVMGPPWMFKLYFIPYLVNIIWLDVVTYLHHHGQDSRIPWYRGKEWNYMRGGLSTIDRDYGWFNNIHHDIGTHVVHHLFPQIPHYHLVEATEAVKPILGQYYREPKKSGPFPIHLLKPLLQSLSQDHYVKDEGEVLFYQTDSKSTAKS
eukprot:c20865_g1_i2 orf=272-1615(+)